MDDVSASDRDLLAEALELYRDDVAADRDNRDQMTEDLRIYAGEQWDSADVEARRAAGRPCLTMNQFPQYVRQVVNDARIKPPAIAVRPVDSGADTKTAEIYTGLTRDIEQRSQAESAYIRALEHAVICGIGHFRITTEYARDDAFDLDIAIRSIRSPFAVTWDAGATEQTRADAMHCFVEETLTLREFRRRWPKVDPRSWDDVGSAWFNSDAGVETVRVAEYWWRVPDARTLLLLADGRVVDEADLDAETLDGLMAAGMILRSRDVDSWKVRQCLLSGGAVLEPPSDWPGAYIPIVPVLGEEIDLGDRTLRRGLIRGGRDAQRMLNLHRSALAEAAGLAPKAKWLLTPDQWAGHEARWSRANIANDPVLLYNPDPSAGQPPQRIAPDVPSQALLAEVQMAGQDLQSTIGIYRASLGQESNERSGKAVIARQREGDVGTYHFIDNLSRAIMRGGTILVDLIPRVYDNMRVVRTLGEDGSEEPVQINAPTPDGRRINDLSVGKYDVTVTVAPSYSTRREETRESMMAVSQAYPGLMQIAPDLIVEAMDWPGADKISARLRRALPPGIAEPKEGDPPPQPQPPSPETMIAQAELIKAQANAQKAMADVELRRVELAIEAEKARQQGVRIEDQGNAAAVNAATSLMKAAAPAN